jgi:hypothetical protein
MSTDRKIELALEGESQIEIFQKSEVRKVLNNGEWWFSVNDVLEVLAETKDGSEYAKKLRQRDLGLKEGWGQIVTPLPFQTKGGVQNINFVSIEGIFRLIQSIPSKKVEPFKKWLAKVGFERVQEIQNPELAIKRAVAIYSAKGYSTEWIEARIPNKIARERLEEEWQKRGITEPVEFAILTDAISEETFGLDTSDHKEIKGLGKNHNLRDNMTPIELTLTTLAEQATREIAEATDAQNFHAHKIAAKSGGSIAGQARREIEDITGKPVVSATNYLTDRQKNNLKKLKG